MSQGAGAGATRSRGPTGGDATVEPAKVRRLPALARLPGHIPQGTLFRPSTRPPVGMRPRRERLDADATNSIWPAPLEEAAA